MNRVFRAAASLTGAAGLLLAGSTGVSSVGLPSSSDLTHPDWQAPVILKTGTTRLQWLGDGGGTLVPSASLSPSGRQLVFTSDRPNQVPGDSNNNSDVFVKDFNSGRLTRVSTTSDGTEGDHWSDSGRFTADGQSVVFRSAASNFGAPLASEGDYFVKSLVTGQLQRLLSAPAADFGKSRVAFSTAAPWGDYNGLQPRDNVYVKDLETGEVTLVSQGISGAAANGPCNFDDADSTVRFVIMDCYATNLVAANQQSHGLYVRDLVRGTTKLVSWDPKGKYRFYEAFNAAISADGKRVWFTGFWKNPPQRMRAGLYGFTKNLVTGAVSRATETDGGARNYTSDRSRLAFRVSDRGQSVDEAGIYVARTSSLSSGRLVLGVSHTQKARATYSFQSWSPDGKRILYLKITGSSSYLYLSPLIR